MEIYYQNSLANIHTKMLNGFFVNWPNPPSNTQLFSILSNSAYINLAVEGDAVVGFVNAISDKNFSAYIPLLEVITSYHGKGIGSKLIRLMEEQLRHIYMLDLCCDDDLVDYYLSLGYTRSNGMLKRNYKALSKK